MAHFQFRDLTPAFGSEVLGFEPVALEAEERDRLRRAFDERGLLLFRGIDIDRAYQTELIDGLIGYDRPADGATQDKFVVSNKEPGGYAPHGRLLFHSDMMWAPEPFQVLSLYGLEVEQPSVPTSFVEHRGRLGHAPRRPQGTCRRSSRGQCDGPATSRGGRRGGPARSHPRARAVRHQLGRTPAPADRPHAPLREPDEHP